MKLKRILSAFLCVVLLSHGVFAFTPYVPDEDTFEDQNASPEENDQTENEDSASETAPGSNISVGARPDEYQYKLFMEILELYTNVHLYEFSRDEVIDKFFYDFLSDNPMYLKFFLEYLLGTMDPYSSYHTVDSDFLDPNVNNVGFGFMVADSDEGVYIQEVIENSSAERAGFMAGDRFVSIEGINVEMQTFSVVRSVLANIDMYKTQEDTEEDTSTNLNRQPVGSDPLTGLLGNIEIEEDIGEQGPKYEIVVERGGELLTMRLAKAHMEASQISTSIEENNGKKTAYIQVSTFLGDDTDIEFANLLRSLEKDGIKNLTIDLRDNGGGSLDYALSMAENFLEQDELICYYNERGLKEPTPIYSTNGKISFDSVVIIINENTASAAELFTSILKDKGIAKVVGAKSYGKSVGQTVYSLYNGDYITITTYQMLSENLESYNGIGIIPDIEIQDVLTMYELPALGIFNHTNAQEITKGVYSEVTKALEDRMVIMGILREEFCDGIWDDISSTSIFVLQNEHKIEATGTVTFETVSLITRLINAYKNYNYLDNTQYDVAMIIHHSFSQGTRLAEERERLRQKESERIAAKDAELLAKDDLEDAIKEAEMEKAEQENQGSNG